MAKDLVQITLEDYLANTPAEALFAISNALAVWRRRLPADYESYTKIVDAGEALDDVGFDIQNGDLVLEED